MVGLQCIFAILAIFLFALAQPQQGANSFSGNLDPIEQEEPTMASKDRVTEDGGGDVNANEVPLSFSSGNISEPTGVPASMPIDNQSEENARTNSELLSSQPEQLDGKKKKQPRKKASKPLPKAQSVGFKPPEEEEQEVIQEIKVDKEKPVVRFIPDLPARCVAITLSRVPNNDRSYTFIPC